MNKQRIGELVFLASAQADEATFASYDLHGAEDPIADIRTQFGVN